MTHSEVTVSRWPILVEQIVAGSESAVEELYLSLRTIRIFLVCQVGRDHASDAYHDAIMDLVAAIRKGCLQEAHALPAYAMTIARRRACTGISEMIRQGRTVNADRVVLCSPASQDPEQLLLQAERQEIARRILAVLPARHRETLARFYLKGESQEEIKATMGINDTQFRLIKSRAKARYAELVQQAMNRPANQRSIAPAAA